MLHNVDTRIQRRWLTSGYRQRCGLNFFRESIGLSWCSLLHYSCLVAQIRNGLPGSVADAALSSWSTSWVYLSLSLSPSSSLDWLPSLHLRLFLLILLVTVASHCVGVLYSCVYISSCPSTSPSITPLTEETLSFAYALLVNVLLFSFIFSLACLIWSNVVF